MTDSPDMNDDFQEQTLRKMYKDAILVQDACNLSGIVISFARVMSDLRALFPSKGTEFFNTHPIAVLYADKIKSLTGDDFEGAYKEAQKYESSHHG